MNCYIRQNMLLNISGHCTGTLYRTRTRRTSLPVRTGCDIEAVRVTRAAGVGVHVTGTTSGGHARAQISHGATLQRRHGDDGCANDCCHSPCC